MRRSIKVTLTFAGFAAVICLLHLPSARSLLARAGGCPFPTTQRTLGPAAAEQLRLSTLRRSAGERAVGLRHAAGFTLGRDTRSDIEKWAHHERVECQPDSHGAGVTCASVQDAEPMRLMFAFDTSDRLVGVQVQSGASTLESARQTVAESERALVAQGGQSLTGLSELRRPLGQARAQLRAANYSADIVITHIGEQYAVYESYQAL